MDDRANKNMDNQILSKDEEVKEEDLIENYQQYLNLKQM